MTERKRISILGCSFSDAKFNKNELSWSHYLAQDNPNIDVYNFAESGHGIDYLLFVLNWMVNFNFKSDLILLNIPPMNRRCHFNDISGLFDVEVYDELKDLFSFDTITENLFKSGTKISKLMSSSYTWGYDGSEQKFKLTKDPLFKIQAFHEMHVMNEQYYAINYITAINHFLNLYEKLLNCKIYFYSFEEYRRYSKYFKRSNFIKQDYPYDWIPKNFTDCLTGDNHLNTKGNRIFYEHYILNDTNIQKEIGKLNDSTAN